MTRSKLTPPPLLLSLLILPLAALGCLGQAGCGAIKRFMYEHPGRDGWQQPSEVVAALALEEGDFVADLGAGGGYFAYPIAALVGESGRVYAVDVDETLLAYVARQAEKRGLPQVETVKAGEADPGLADASVDLVFLSNVFHHLPEPAGYALVEQHLFLERQSFQVFAPRSD